MTLAELAKRRVRIRNLLSEAQYAVTAQPREPLSVGGLENVVALLDRAKAELERVQAESAMRGAR